MSELIKKFQVECINEIKSQGEDLVLRETTRKWMDLANTHKYSYHFEWLGRPIIQYPQDIIALQEIIWRVQPDLIIETGIAHGGSLIFSASMLALLDHCEGLHVSERDGTARPARKVIGVDIEIRRHNRIEIEKHPLSSRIQMIEGSSIAPDVIESVRHISRDFQRVLVILDSNHTDEHVTAELEAYSPLVSVGSYCVVFDTVIEDMPDWMFPDRPWGKLNNPKMAVRKFLATHDEFQSDDIFDSKLMISVAPGGYLKRVR